MVPVFVLKAQQTFKFVPVGTLSGDKLVEVENHVGSIAVRPIYGNPDAQEISAVDENRIRRKPQCATGVDSVPGKLASFGKHTKFFHSAHVFDSSLNPCLD